MSGYLTEAQRNSLARRLPGVVFSAIVASALVVLFALWRGAVTFGESPELAATWFATAAVHTWGFACAVSFWIDMRRTK